MFSSTRISLSKAFINLYFISWPYTKKRVLILLSFFVALTVLSLSGCAGLSGTVTYSDPGSGIDITIDTDREPKEDPTQETHNAPPEAIPSTKTRNCT